MNRKNLVLVMCALFIGPSILAQVKLANADAPLVAIDRWKQALSGHDPVGYFDYGEATPGIREFHTPWAGVYYTFASKVTRKKFISDPERFLPQFGGYCALSLALEEGEVASRAPGLWVSNPNSFKVVNGRLYMFSTDFDFDPVERWNQNEAVYLARAEERWKTIVASRK